MYTLIYEKRLVKPTMQSQQRQASLDAANAAKMTPTPTTPTGSNEHFKISNRRETDEL